MIVAIISDIHANLEALDAVLKRIEEIRVDKILCLGDIVGYGPNPNECLQRIKRVVDGSVVGNHEYGVLGLTDLRCFSVNARLACEWTREILSKENISYISEMPVKLTIDGMLLVHSTPHIPLDWNYILNLGDARSQFVHLKQKICLVGHSHEPIVFANRDNVCKILGKSSFSIDEESQYIINFGSVGQPRDYDPRAAFGVIDLEKREVQLIRVPYDIENVQKKIIDRGLPRFLAERLRIGA